VRRLTARSKSTDLGQLSIPSSIGQFGWYGAATTYCQIDPKEKIVAMALVQHFPFNEHNVQRIRFQPTTQKI